MKDPVVTISRSYGDSSDGQTIHLSVEETVELRLAENPTTGFRWLPMAIQGSGCAVTFENFEASSGPPGSGGQHSWIIQGVQPGECVIELRYQRRFGRPAEPERTFRIIICVESR
jgi:predicted secreted protein